MHVLGMEFITGPNYREKDGCGMKNDPFYHGFALRWKKKDQRRHRSKKRPAGHSFTFMCETVFFWVNQHPCPLWTTVFFGILFHPKLFVCNKTPFHYEQNGLHVFSSTQHGLYGSLIRHISMSDDSILITTHNPLM